MLLTILVTQLGSYYVSYIPRKDEIIGLEKNLFQNYWNLNRDLLVPISKLKNELQSIPKETWTFPGYQTSGSE